jgi:hypothetical protein
LALIIAPIVLLLCCTVFFSQMLIELERQGQVLCDREQQRITLVHAP